MLPDHVSYASQEPWVYSSTLRDNVLFGLPYRKDWYDRVIEACALDKVRVELNHGENNIIIRGVGVVSRMLALILLAILVCTPQFMCGMIL